MSVDREIRVVIYTIHFADVIHPGVSYFTGLRDFLHVLRITQTHYTRILLTAHAPNTCESQNFKADVDRQCNDRHQRNHSKRILLTAHAQNTRGSRNVKHVKADVERQFLRQMLSWFRYLTQHQHNHSKRPVTDETSMRKTGLIISYLHRA